MEAIKAYSNKTTEKNDTIGNDKCSYFNVSDRKYTKEELSAFFSSIDDLGELV